MNNVDKVVAEEINQCAPTIDPSTSHIDPRAEEMEKIDAALEDNLLTKEASKFYAEPHELQEMEQKQASNLLVTMAQQIEDADNVNHPQHYTGSIECIDAMLQQFGKEQVKSFCLLNAFKYLFRCNKKHDTPI